MIFFCCFLSYVSLNLSVVCIIFILPLTLDLICSSFFSYSRLKFISLILSTLFLIRHMANFPSNHISSASHTIFDTSYFLTSIWNIVKYINFFFSLILGLFRNVSFNFQLFGNFHMYFCYIANLSALWYKNILYLILIPWNLMRSYMVQLIEYIYKCFRCMWKNSAMVGRGTYASIRWSRLIALFNYFVSLLIYQVFLFSIDKKE